MNLVKLRDIKLVLRNQLYFYTLIMMGQKEKENNSIYICIKNNKLSQGGERLTYTLNYKTLMRECLWFGRINIVKMSIVSKAIYRFSTISIKIPIAFSTKLEKNMLKFEWNHKRL